MKEIISQSNHLYIVGVQIANVDAISKQNVEENIQRAATFIKNHKQLNSKARFYLLPELSSCGYPMGSKFENLDQISETVQNSISISEYKLLSKSLNVYISFGFILKEDEKYYITQGVTNDKGELVCLYRKLHLCSFGDCNEQCFFSRPVSPFENNKTFGINNDQTIHLRERMKQLLPTFECDGFKIGICICYDIRFPEIARILALHYKCDIILHPSAFPRDKLSWNWNYCATSRAIENQVYILTINRAGEHFGASHFCPPWVSELSDKHRILTSSTTDECTLEINIDRKLLNKIREEVTFRADRYFPLEEIVFESHVSFN